VQNGDTGHPVAVLLTSRQLNLGGLERDVAKMAIGLDRSRFEPHVATFYQGGLRYEEVREAGVPMLHLPVSSFASAGAMKSAWRLVRYIRRNRIRVVHSYDASGNFVAPVARLAGVPVVLTSQLSYRTILDPGTARLSRLSDRFAHAVLVNCEAVRRHMIDDEGLPAARVELVYNGVDTSQFHPAAGPKPDALEGSSLVIGTVCVMRPEKALPMLQEAFARVLPLDPRMKLAIVGEGEELPRLSENAARLRLGHSCLLLPATRDVPLWMRAIDIFVLPSYSEAFSNSLLEAMACGCCVLGSRVGGTPELIGENERGLLFQSGNIDDLARQLARLIAGESLRRELGARAARYAREQLSLDLAIERTSAMWQKLLARQRA
jgi:glycosyltransferase involved in cell wall biosynthesis